MVLKTGTRAQQRSADWGRAGATAGAQSDCVAVYVASFGFVIKEGALISIAQAPR